MDERAESLMVAEAFEKRDGTFAVSEKAIRCAYRAWEPSGKEQQDMLAAMKRDASQRIRRNAACRVGFASGRRSLAMGMAAVIAIGALGLLAWMLPAHQAELIEGGFAANGIARGMLEGALPYGDRESVLYGEQGSSEGDDGGIVEEAQGGGLLSEPPEARSADSEYTHTVQDGTGEAGTPEGGGEARPSLNPGDPVYGFIDAKSATYRLNDGREGLLAPLPASESEAVFVPVDALKAPIGAVRLRGADGWTLLCDLYETEEGGWALHDRKSNRYVAVASEGDGPASKPMLDCSEADGNGEADDVAEMGEIDRTEEGERDKLQKRP